MRGVHNNRKIEEFFAKAPVATITDGSTPKNAPQASTAAAAVPETKSVAPTKPRDAKRVKKEGPGEEAVVKKSEKGAKARGKLSLLPSLPLDILFEIFKLLMPTDILHLTRTTKALRAVLLHRSAMTVWKETLKQIDDFPKCPDDISLPYWTSLIFDTFCHNCLARNTSSVNFIFRIRCCNKWAKSILVPLSRYPRECDLIAKAVPCDAWNDGFGQQALRTDVDAFLAKWKNRSNLGDQLVEERAAAAKRKEMGKEVRKWYDKRGDQRAEEISTIRKERARDIRHKLKDLGFETELTFLLRFYSVCLIDPLPYGISFSEHPHVKQPKPLTDHIWKNIEPDMVELMHKMRDYKTQNDRIILQRERRKAIHRLYLEWRNQKFVLYKYPAWYVMPGPLDVLGDAQVKQLLELPNDVEIDDFTAQADVSLRLHLPSIVRSFRHDRNIIFLNAIERVTSVPGVVSFLSWYRHGYSASSTHGQFALAAVVFRCKAWAHEYVDGALARDQGAGTFEYGRWKRAGTAPEPLLWYPEFLTHACCALHWDHHGNFGRRPKPEGNFNAGGMYDGSDVYQRAWKDKELEFNQVASRNVLRILKACGMSDKTTVEELDARDPRVVCLTCSFGAKCDGERTMRIWGWREVVNHSVSTQFGNSVVEWQCLSPEDTAEAKRLEDTEHVKKNYPTPANKKVWRCTAWSFCTEA
ncbi:hypothetical protein D9619_009185 [Psilocybe cf. subviscida]|uniref:F-box domain-containing protein n=1 Tax=Psilocybe cf. subviscida TaxID=2480587 RepID=A0A8H5BVY1_9AGAR|nr:hypothetical protein D9619_009185 [Psilocybe cf. subviscida]